MVDPHQSSKEFAMLTQINGLHHVTSLAGGAQRNNQFFTQVLGLRRVKKTVNFDHPHVYHLYYGDEVGTPGSVMTYFPFPNKSRGTPGVGEVSITQFAVPVGALPFWRERLAALNVSGLVEKNRFGGRQLEFSGPDGDVLALVEQANDDRVPWGSDGIANDYAIRGFHGASFRLAETAASAELLAFMGYQATDEAEGVTRFSMIGGNGADIIDLEAIPSADPARRGTGSVHHIAFSVDNRQTQLEVRKALVDTGYDVTPVINRNYFWAIYFRTPGGVLFEVATNEPGFDWDEDSNHLGNSLMLPPQHEHRRADLEQSLEPISD
jgi:glyoxalase family protein